MTSLDSTAHFWLLKDVETLSASLFCHVVVETLSTSLFLFFNKGNEVSNQFVWPQHVLFVHGVVFCLLSCFVFQFRSFVFCYSALTLRSKAISVFQGRVFFGTHTLRAFRRPSLIFPTVSAVSEVFETASRCRSQFLKLSAAVVAVS